MTKVIDTNQFYPYEIIQDKSQKYLYNVVTSGIFLLDKQSNEILDNRVLVDDYNEEYKGTIQYMKDKFIIKTSENANKLEEIYDRMVSNKKEMNPSSLILMVSQDCNLRCTYCYGVNGEYRHKGLMNESTAKKAVDYFMKYAKTDKLNICFFGGEPLLNFNLIKKVVEYARELEQKASKKFTFSMTTNATLITQEIEEFIIKNKVSLTISIDGSREIQNINRYYSNKRGCYDEVIKNTKKLMETNSLTARATITPQNLDLLHSVDHLIEAGFRRVAWAPALNLLSNEDIEKMSESQKGIVLKVEECIEKGDYNRARKYQTIIDMLKKINSDGLRTKGCGAGSNMMAVNIEGSIYPCHRFVGNEFMSLGNINLEESCKNDYFYNNVELKGFEKCTSCIAKNICAGGCVNENFEENYDIRVAPDKHCNYYINVAKEVIKLYIRLDENSKEKLFGKS